MQGFDAVNWESNVDFDLKAITFSYHSQNGEEGFPGDLNVFAKYSLSTNGKALQIEYSATSTKKTPINLSNHMYFNLAGHETGKYSRAMIFQLIFCYFFFYSAKYDTWQDHTDLYFCKFSLSIVQGPIVSDHLEIRRHSTSYNIIRIAKQYKMYFFSWFNDGSSQSFKVFCYYFCQGSLTKKILPLEKAIHF